MTDGLAPAFRVGGELERCTDFQAPSGTASVSIDQVKRVMHIFCDPEVDPVDWAFVCCVLAEYGVSDLGEPEYVKGVDVFTAEFP